MTPIPQKEPDTERQPSTNLWDTLIRVGLIAILAFLCFRALSPFLNLIVESIILAVALYPLHQALARRIGGRQSIASTILVLLGITLIVVPSWLLMNSFADSVHGFVASVQQNTLQIPAPSDGVRNWPLIGRKVFDFWSMAHTDLPGLVQSMQPKLGELARYALGVVASIIMAYGNSSARSSQAFFSRVAGSSRGEVLAKLSVSTIRAVALGVVGVAAIQALLIGTALLIAGIPVAGLLAIIALILGIAQVPAVILTIPVIIYIWSSGDYSTGAAVAHTIILLLTGMADNVLKPLMLGRGVAVPMPVILLGALGGMATGGILGMFVGATVLALSYELFTNWVAPSADTDPAAMTGTTTQQA